MSAYTKYTTRVGDTFDLVAFQVYDNEKMAFRIIEANPDYADIIIFDKSVTLRIPVFEDNSKPETLAPWRRG